jgi:type IV pilus assembly protein PilM
MSLLHSLQSLFRDSPPAFAFEVSEAGVAYAVPDHAGEIRFREFAPETVSVSPARDNILKPDLFQTHVASLAPSAAHRKRRPAALILPDHSARVQVLDFDSFPGSVDEQSALIRFRVKKSVPFDVDSAAVSYHVQSKSGKNKIEVVAAVMSLEIVARYEAAFRAAGYAPGFVTTSALAALNLMPAAGLNVLVKLSGQVLSVAALDGSHLNLVRTVELDQVESDDILAVLYPTLAYLEDELSTKVERILTCGFGASAQRWAAGWESELATKVEPLQSRRGAPGPFNAGLLGYLEAVGGVQ